MDTDLDVKEAINDIISESLAKVETLIASFHDKSLEQLPGRSLAETLELRILETLNLARKKRVT